MVFYHAQIFYLVDGDLTPARTAHELSKRPHSIKWKSGLAGVDQRSEIWNWGARRRGRR